MKITMQDGSVTEMPAVEWLRNRSVSDGKLSIESWPAWTLELMAKRIPEDRGIGDTVEREIGLMGSPSFRAWFTAQFGAQHPCPNCPALWNRRYPYPAK